jgi:hypothetical protein
VLDIGDDEIHLWLAFLDQIRDSRVLVEYDNFISFAAKATTKQTLHRHLDLERIVYQSSRNGARHPVRRLQLQISHRPYYCVFYASLVEGQSGTLEILAFLS